MRLQHGAADEWISWVEATQILDCSESTVGNYVSAGRLRPRPRHGPRPSLRTSDVKALAADLRRERSKRAARAARRAARRARKTPHPPDDDHEWLTASAASRILGVSTGRVNQRALAGTLPYTVQDGRRWYRRDLIEMVASARAFRAQHTVAEPGGPRAPD